MNYEQDEIYKTAPEWIEAIKAHSCHDKRLLSVDDPKDEVVGIVCMCSDIGWGIDMRDLKATIADVNDSELPNFNQDVRDFKGRHKIAFLLSDDKALEKSEVKHG